MKYLFFFSLLFLMASCGDKEERLNYIIATDFPREVQVTGRVFSSLDHHRILNVTLIDSFLIVVTPSDSNYIHVYSTKTERNILKLSSRGRGPGEFMSGNPVRAVSDSDKLLFVVFEYITKEITKVDLIRSVNENRFIYERFPNGISTREGDIPVETMHYYSKERAIYRREFNEGTRFSIFNFHSGEITNIPVNYPQRKAYHIPESELSRVFITTNLGVNARLNRIASGPLLLGELDFFDLDGNYVATTLYADPDTIKRSIYDLYDSPNAIHPYNSGIYSDDDFVYVLYDNYRIGFIPPAPGEATGHRIPSPEASGHTNELLVFDWNGQPVKKILFDRFIRDFAIEYRQGVIFGIYRHPEDGDKIIEYRF